jgi:hypothetical protein
MKNRLLFGLAALIGGVLIALGPQYIFKICEQTHGHGDITRCFWMARAEIGIGSSILIIGFVYIIFGKPRLAAGLTIAAALETVQAFLIPNLLIGVCPHQNMACRLATLPALNVISFFMALFMSVNAIYLFKIYRKNVRGDA